MRFSRLQAGSRPQVRHRPQSVPSPFPLPRPLPFPCPSQANFQVTQIDFARKFMRTLLHICEYVHQLEPSRAPAREGASASVSAPAAVPDSFSQRIFRHVADKRSKAALRCLRLWASLPPSLPRATRLLLRILFGAVAWWNARPVAVSLSPRLPGNEHDSLRKVNWWCCAISSCYLKTCAPTATANCNCNSNSISHSHSSNIRNCCSEVSKFSHWFFS